MLAYSCGENILVCRARRVSRTTPAQHLCASAPFCSGQYSRCPRGGRLLSSEQMNAHGRVRAGCPWFALRVRITLISLFHPSSSWMMRGDAIAPGPPPSSSAFEWPERKRPQRRQGGSEANSLSAQVQGTAPQQHGREVGSKVRHRRRGTGLRSTTTKQKALTRKEGDWTASFFFFRG